MASPTTSVEIMSNAAILLGHDEITDLSSAKKFGVALQSSYDLLLDAEIATNRWRFAAKTQELAELADLNPSFGIWQHAYALPADFLAMKKIYPSISYEIFGDKIYTSGTSSIAMEYYYQAPVTHMSAPFKLYFTYALAAHLALSTAENANLVAQLRQQAALLEAKAMFSSSQNGINMDALDQPYINARY